MILTVLIVFSTVVIVGYGYGGSSGGNGVTTSNIDPYNNIAKYERVEKNLVYNKSVEYSFTTPEFSIYQILVNGRENEFNIPIRIEDLKNTSVYAKRAPGIVYRNENVWLGSTRIKYIGVKFKVKNSWIDENDGRLPYLLKWNGTVWMILRTNMTGKDGVYTYFESPKAGNSRIGIFAISAPMKNNTMNRATNVSLKNMEQYEEVRPNIVEEKEKMDSEKLPGFGAVSVVIAIISVALSLIYASKRR